MRKSNGLRKRDARGGAGSGGDGGRQVATPPLRTPVHLPAGRPPGSSNVGVRAVGEGAAKQQSGVVVLAAGIGATTAAAPAASAARAAIRLVLQSRVELHQHKHLQNREHRFGHLNYIILAKGGM